MIHSFVRARRCKIIRNITRKSRIEKTLSFLRSRDLFLMDCILVLISRSIALSFETVLLRNLWRTCLGRFPIGCDEDILWIVGREREREKERRVENPRDFSNPLLTYPLIHFLLFFLPLLFRRPEIFSLNSCSQRWYNRRRHIPWSPKNIPCLYRRRSNTRNTIIFLRREISFFEKWNFFKIQSNI